MHLRYWLLLAALPACTDSYEYEPDPGFGELGVGVFLYECPTSGDSLCDGGNPAPVFPKAFALGGRIHLQYDWKDDSDHATDPLPQLQSASPELLAPAGDGFTAVATGYAAVLAVTGNSEVVDLRHLHIRDIDRLQVSDTGEALALTELQLDPGAEVLLQARALDADAVTLGGVLGYTWSTADADTLAIVAGADAGQVRVRAEQGGDTTLTLTLGERSVVVAVHVGDAQDTDTSATGTDSATDGATDGSGDTTDSSGTGDTTDATGSDTGSTTGASSSTGGAL